MNEKGNLMNHKFLKAGAAGIILTAGCIAQVANAGLITQGNLTYDNTGEIISNNANTREYLALDVLATLTYAQTVEATTTGAYIAWSIATSVIAQGFIDELFGGTSACSLLDDFTETCGSLPGWHDGKLGISFASNLDALLYLHDDINDVKMTYMLAGGVVHDYGNSIANYDAYSGGNIDISFLLYRDVQNQIVHEPTTLAIFALGMIGLASRRFKKES